jgi:hypothetical protein
MIRTRAGKLNDRFGRQVTEEDTSLILKAMVTKDGVFIFHANDINEDDNIPAP